MKPPQPAKKTGKKLDAAAVHEAAQLSSSLGMAVAGFEMAYRGGRVDRAGGHYAIRKAES